MPVILAILGALAAAAFWYWRLKAAREAADELLNAAQDIRLAARRFSYRSKMNTHPADAVDDARLAAAGIIVALAGMKAEPSEAQLAQMADEAQAKFNVPADEAQEIVTFGRWLASRCINRDEAIRRLSKRVRDLAGAEALPDLRDMIAAVNGEPTEEQALVIARMERTVSAG